MTRAGDTGGPHREERRKKKKKEEGERTRRSAFLLPWTYLDRPECTRVVFVAGGRLNPGLGWTMQGWTDTCDGNGKRLRDRKWEVEEGGREQGRGEGAQGGRDADTHTTRSPLHPQHQPSNRPGSLLPFPPITHHTHHHQPPPPTPPMLPLAHTNSTATAQSHSHSHSSSSSSSHLPFLNSSSFSHSPPPPPDPSPTPPPPPAPTPSPAPAPASLTQTRSARFSLPPIPDSQPSPLPLSDTDTDTDPSSQPPHGDLPLRPYPSPSAPSHTPPSTSSRRKPSGKTSPLPLSLPDTSAAATPTLRWSNLSYTVPAQQQQLALPAVVGALRAVTGRASGGGARAGPAGNGNGRTQVLFGLSGSLHNGDLLALLGGSGSGKTTLLNCLSGRIPRGGVVSGEITFGGKERERDKWPREYGFVEAQDAHFVRLTAGEVLTYSARFRMKGAGKKEMEARVEDVAGELGLLAALATPVGAPQLGMPGLSTGQRKRLSLAVELLGHPRVLFLDEPTSGLDAFHALSVVEHLRGVCKRGARAAAVAVHQPRETMLALFDKVAVMAQGRTVYFGSVAGAVEHFGSVGFPVPAGTNPADWWLDVSTVDTRDAVREKASRARMTMLHEAWEEKGYGRASVSRAVSSRMSLTRPYDAPVESYTLSWRTEFVELVKLSVTLVTRDIVLIRTKAFASVGLVFLFSLLFWRVDVTTADGLASLLGALYLYQLSIAFQLGTHPITVFLTNRDVIRRERGERDDPAPTLDRALFDRARFLDVPIRVTLLPFVASFMYRATTLFLARWIALLPLYCFFAVFEALVFWVTIGLSDVVKFALTNVVYT
ncbi:hypothetical protein HDU93_003814 [Gonapodya sp. JEL0774]|nr:hypothetical protein HDU93_003814 [Gonapodya sp. JEL0774]